jgi:hypothetical protein
VGPLEIWDNLRLIGRHLQRRDHLGQSGKRRDTLGSFLTHNHWLNMELDLQCLFVLHVYSCTHWLRRRTPPLSPRILAHIRGRNWSAKIDDVSL